VPLRAGDCTFHHSYLAHMANSNVTEVPRVAHIVIYMDADTTFNGNGHVVTDPLNLQVGQPLDGEFFPPA
jgi:phytanoyl-CoA hydroxylase